MVVFTYFNRLFSLWLGKLFVLVDLIALVAIFSGKTLLLPTWIYWLVAALFFLIANIRIYAELDKQIKEYKSQEATILAKVLKSYMTVDTSNINYRNRIKGYRQDGLDRFGLPIKTELITVVDIENFGIEEGELVFKNDWEKSELPSFFRFKTNDNNGHFYSGGKSGRTIKGRIRVEDHWSIQLSLTEDDPEIFAKQISDAPKYRLYLNYWTKRVGGESDKSLLVIEGDLTEYRDTLIKKWDDRKMTELVRIASKAHSVSRLG